MYSRHTAKTRRCPRCGTGEIYTGVQAAHNPKSADGHVVCAGCKADEVIQATIDRINHERSISEAP